MISRTPLQPLQFCYSVNLKIEMGQLISQVPIWDMNFIGSLAPATWISCFPRFFWEHQGILSIAVNIHIQHLIKLNKFCVLRASHSCLTGRWMALHSFDTVHFWGNYSAPLRLDCHFIIFFSIQATIQLLYNPPYEFCIESLSFPSYNVFASHLCIIFSLILKFIVQGICLVHKLSMQSAIFVQTSLLLTMTLQTILWKTKHQCSSFCILHLRKRTACCCIQNMCYVYYFLKDDGYFLEENPFTSCSCVFIANIHIDTGIGRFVT